jgi:hypothetical protein
VGRAAAAKTAARLAHLVSGVVALLGGRVQGPSEETAELVAHGGIERSASRRGWSSVT